MNAQFLVARYIANLERREARNIGVIVWTKGSVLPMFADASDLEFIEDHENYARWISYWTELCGQKRMQLYSLPAVTVNTPRFLKVLQKTQRGNYVLDMGGEFVDDVTGDNIAEAAKFLFSRLVKPFAADSGQEQLPTLADKCLRQEAAVQ